MKTKKTGKYLYICVFIVNNVSEKRCLGKVQAKHFRGIVFAHSFVWGMVHIVVVMSSYRFHHNWMAIVLHHHHNAKVVFMFLLWYWDFRMCCCFDSVRWGCTVNYAYDLMCFIFLYIRIVCKECFVRIGLECYCFTSVRISLNIHALQTFIIIDFTLSMEMFLVGRFISFSLPSWCVPVYDLQR